MLFLLIILDQVFKKKGKLLKAVARLSERITVVEKRSARSEQSDTEELNEEIEKELNALPLTNLKQLERFEKLILKDKNLHSKLVNLPFYLYLF